MAFTKRHSRKRSVAANTAGFSSYNRVRVVKGGKHFFELLCKLIRDAESSIHIQTYAFADDETGSLVADALMEAAQRGIKVYLLIDGYASQKLPKQFIKKLRDSGIHFRYFEPLLKSKYFYFGRRLHHKLHIFDGVRAIVGSMNIADRYNDTAGEKSWLDMALYVEGETAIRLEAICWQFWLRKRRRVAHDEKAMEFAHSIPPEDQVPVRIRQNDWVMRKIEISRSYYHLFGNAQDRIYIMCSYFLPGKRILRQLRRAAARGVKIHVVLAGTSDVKTAKFAERYLYRWMFRHKMSVYEYQPSVLHAKMSIADGEFLTLGSYNINGLSAYASIELNLDAKDKKLGEVVEKQIQRIINEDCKAADPEVYIYKIFTPRQLLYWLSYQFMNFMLTISTFYYKQHS